MKKRAFAALVLAMAVVLAACGTNSDTGASGAKFNDQDVTFAQGMIPHHRQAIEMAKLAESRASSTKVAELATAIQDAQDPEIKTMEGWLKDWDKPLDGEGSSGMDHGSDDSDSMSGMMSDDEMRSMEGASGADFDMMFLAMMIRHHEGAIAMSDKEIAEGENTEAIALAKTIKKAQTDEIATMKGLLEQ